MADLIGAVTLNLALDITYHVDRLVAGGSHRVETVGQRAGGKGVNVARVCRILGGEALALGFVGGRTGELIETDLYTAELPALLTPIAGESRRSVAVVDREAGDATVFNEAGPVVGPDEWRAFGDRVPWGRLGVLVCSGSLPPGLRPDAYAELAARARHHGVPTVVDAGGEVLLAAAKAGAVVRANAAELRDALGDVDVVAGGKQLLDLGASAAVLTDGAAGMVAVSPAGVWRAVPVERVAGNPTGAGDAVTAVVACHHHRHHRHRHRGVDSSQVGRTVDDGLTSSAPGVPPIDWPAVLRSAVAASSAAVLTPVAGDIDLAAYRRWLPQVVVDKGD